MPFHLYKARNASGAGRWLGIHIEYDEDHWVATCSEVDADGHPVGDGHAVAPRFLGVTANQVHRRMVDALTGTYEELEPAREGMAG